MFRAAKDAVASRAAQVWVNRLIARYGKVHRLKIDTHRRTVEASCQLDGELTSITITIENYAIETEGEQNYIRATVFTCTRLWLQTLLTDFGHRKRIELPAWAAAALSSS